MQFLNIASLLVSVASVAAVSTTIETSTAVVSDVSTITSSIISCGPEVTDCPGSSNVITTTIVKTLVKNYTVSPLNNSNFTSPSLSVFSGVAGNTYAQAGAAAVAAVAALLL